MRNHPAVLPPNQVDPDLQHRSFFVQQVCLVLVLQIAVIALLGEVSSRLGAMLPSGLTRMHPYSAISALLCVLSLYFSEAERSRNLHGLAKILAALTVLFSTLSLLERLVLPRFHLSLGLPGRTDLSFSGTRPAAAPVAFFLLALVLAFVSAQRPWARRIVDGVTAILCFLVLVFSSSAIFWAANVPGAASDGFVSSQTLSCLVLLTAVVVLRRAEYGVFSMFLGYGVGSKIARWLTPVLFLLPIFREIARAHVEAAGINRIKDPTAVLTAMAIVIAFALLFWLAAVINRMQAEVQGLTLRDELTGLHNVRGFNLLAEQTMRHARREKQPFAVLFIDLDNLKTINDRQGHAAGSTLLVETAKLLQEVFRETDVIGRVGGDEFVVAGQFDERSIHGAIERLQASAAERSTQAGRRLPLHFSSGYAIAEVGSKRSLKELVTEADAAMYQHKRIRKTEPATA